jgi:hypothetical protein
MKGVPARSGGAGRLISPTERKARRRTQLGTVCRADWAAVRLTRGRPTARHAPGVMVFESHVSLFSFLGTYRSEARGAASSLPLSPLACIPYPSS